VPLIMIAPLTTCEAGRRLAISGIDRWPAQFGGGQAEIQMTKFENIF